MSSGEIGGVVARTPETEKACGCEVTLELAGPLLAIAGAPDTDIVGELLQLTCDRSVHHDPIHEADLHLTDTKGEQWCVRIEFWPTNHGPEEETSAGIS